MTKCVYRDLRHHFLSCAMLPYRATRYIMNSPSPPNTAQDADSQATLRGSSRNRMWRSVVVGMATVVVSIITIVMATDSGKRDIVRKQLKNTIKGVSKISVPREQIFFPSRSRGKQDCLRGTGILLTPSMFFILYRYTNYRPEKDQIQKNIILRTCISNRL